MIEKRVIIMRISSKSDYALKTLLYLGRNTHKEVISIGEVATAEKIPVKFLEQIFLALKAGGIVGSRRGAKGGYFLAKDAADINLEGVLRLMEDTVLTPVRSAGVQSQSKSPYDEIWEDLDSELRARLISITLRDVCKKSEEMSQKGSLNFSI